MTETLRVTPAQVLLAQLAVELSEEAGEVPDEALKAIANAEVVTDEQSDASSKQTEATIVPDDLPEADDLRRTADLLEEDTSYGRVTRVLLERGETKESLQQRADAGDIAAAGGLAMMLQESGDIQALRRWGDSGQGFASIANYHLAVLLADRGDIEEAIAVLRQEVRTGNTGVAWELAKLLAAQGDVEGLRQEADTGNKDAAVRLAELLAGGDDIEGPRRRGSPA